jgi:hypothetical protein
MDWRHDIRHNDTQHCGITKQVAWNHSSLLQKMILENTQTLQLFSKIIETESIYKSI